MIPLTIHGGNVHAASRANGKTIHEIIDFSASINPLGLPVSAQQALAEAVPGCVHYPDPDGNELREQIGKSFGIDPESIVLGNGSVELINILPRVLSLQHGLIVGPAFMEFERALALNGATYTYVHASAEQGFKPPIIQAQNVLESMRTRKKSVSGRRAVPTIPIDGVFLCNPNSPTGQVVTHSTIKRLLKTVAQANAHLIVDEAFVDFCASHSVLTDVSQSQKLIVLRSFTKFFAMPGLRIGYLTGPPEIVAQFRRWLPPWTVNSLAQATALAALRDHTYRRKSLALIRQERRRLMGKLQELPGVRLFPSQANFLLLELPSPYTADRVTHWCLEHGILVRDCQNFSGMNSRTLRLAVRLPKENDLLVRLLGRALTSCA